jgi:hypothetical protein
LSVSHPIEITGAETTFDFRLFCKNKQIYHIGWWLRNFKSFINFKIPNEFNKTILIKDGFVKEWDILSKRFDIRDITIVKELNNNEYEKLFVNHCMYLDLEDATANNVILECIKFNTPIIVNKSPSVVEYLGRNYPLYFENKNDMKIFESYDYLYSRIKEANIYLKNMDKSHILCETFNNKIKYDLQKAQHNSKSHANMTWFCFIDNLDIKLENLYDNFTSQHNYTRHKLKIIVSDKLRDIENYDHFINELSKYSELFKNISYIVSNIYFYSDFVNTSFEHCDTPYLAIIGIMDNHDPDYTDICCNYLNKNTNIDITFSSYNINENDYTECIQFEKNKMIFVNNFSKWIFPNTGIVWRQPLYNLIGSFTNYNNIINVLRNYLQKCLKSHLNIACCHNVPLYTTR